MIFLTKNVYNDERNKGIDTALSDVERRGLKFVFRKLRVLDKMDFDANFIDGYKKGYFMAVIFLDKLPADAYKIISSFI